MCLQIVFADSVFVKRYIVFGLPSWLLTTVSFAEIAVFLIPHGQRFVIL